MSEPDPTGYRESPDNGDDPASEPRDAPEDDVVLTTDDDAQRDDSTARPGNVPD